MVVASSHQVMVTRYGQYPARKVEIVLTQLPQPSWRLAAWRETDDRVCPRVTRVVRAASQSELPVKSRDLRVHHSAILEAAKPARWTQVPSQHQFHHFPSGIWI